MNRNQRIVVSIVGIAIVLLALIGITYAYWVTRVTYNTEDKSISGTLGVFEIKYGDGNGILSPKDPILPNSTIGPKTFTVENTGSSEAMYAVIFENVNNPLVRRQDLVFTMTCQSNVTSNTCKGVEEKIFPSDTQLILSNKLASKEKHTYSVTVTYKDPGVNQSADMGKTFSAKINIVDGSTFDVPKDTFTEGTLAYTVLHKADQTQEDFAFGTGRSVFLSNPLTIPAQQINGSNEKVISTTPDKYGNSYYFRGMPSDNYLTFADMCWRIVRIQGDGSTKIILQDQTGPCSASTKNDKNAFVSTSTYYYGYRKDSTTGDRYQADYLECTSSKTNCIRYQFQKWFNSKFVENAPSLSGPSDDQQTLKSEYEGKIKYETWEIGDWTTKYTSSGSPYDPQTSGTTWYFEPYVRLINSSSANRYASLMPSESETNVTVKDYVATLTADEVALAGATTSNNSNYYLYNGNYWWTLSPYGGNSSHDYAFRVNSDGHLNGSDVGSSYGARPAVVLESSVQVTGEGTLTNPYVVS